MYRAVIIYCLIAVGCAGTVKPYYNYDNREIRQASLSSVNVQNNTYPTYPEYATKQTTVVPYTVPTTVSSTVPVENPESSSYFSGLTPYFRSLAFYGARTSNYLLSALGVLFLGTSIFGLICSYTTYCDSFLGVNGRREFDTSPNLNDLSSMVFKAMDKFSKVQKRNTY